MNCAVLPCHYPAIKRLWVTLGSSQKRECIAVCQRHYDVAHGPTWPRVPRDRKGV